MVFKGKSIHFLLKCWTFQSFWMKCKISKIYPHWTGRFEAGSQWKNLESWWNSNLGEKQTFSMYLTGLWNWVVWRTVDNTRMLSRLGLERKTARVFKNIRWQKWDWTEVIWLDGISLFHSGVDAVGFTWPSDLWGVSPDTWGIGASLTVVKTPSVCRGLSRADSARHKLLAWIWLICLSNPLRHCYLCFKIKKLRERGQ